MGEAYPSGDAGDRKWRRDIRALRQRGLIETDLPPSRTGISLRVPAKPERLHLTMVEHRAINRARRALRPGIPTVSPLGASGAAALEIDEVTRILRFVEENGDEVELRQLAQLLGVSERQAFDLLDVLTREGVFSEGIVASVEFGYSDTDDDTDEDPLPDTVTVFRGRIDPRSPTRWRGMDQLGFFPYSLPETDDRLALIDEALASKRIAEDLHPALHSARRKLAEWKCELQRREPMS
jgi:DNA-binding Lrp family transcriptional regulator